MEMTVEVFFLFVMSEGLGQVFLFRHWTNILAKELVARRKYISLAHFIVLILIIHVCI